MSDSAIITFNADREKLADDLGKALTPCVRIVVTPNNQVKGGNKEQRCPDTVKRENKLY